MAKLLKVSTTQGKEIKSFLLPRAIPLTEEEIKAANIDVNSLPLAKSIQSQETFKAVALTGISTESEQLENNVIPEKRILTATKTTSNTSPQPAQDNLLVERVQPNFLQPQHQEVNHTSADSTATNNISIFFGALGTTLTILSLVIMVLCAIGLVFYPEQKKLLAGPIAALICGLFYLIFCQKQRCCMCHQRQFVKARNIKKATSHHIKFLGYMLPTCLSIIIRGWYRCMICGTRLRIFRMPKD